MPFHAFVLRFGSFSLSSSGMQFFYNLSVILTSCLYNTVLNSISPIHVNSILSRILVKNLIYFKASLLRHVYDFATFQHCTQHKPTMFSFLIRLSIPDWLGFTWTPTLLHFLPIYFLNCYERDFMLSVSTKANPDIIDAYYIIYCYQDAILNIDNPFIPYMVSQNFP